MDDFDRAIAAMNGIAGELGAVTESELHEVGQLAVGIIVSRTKAGIDVDGHAFEKYTEEYARERTHAGLGTKPDLARTGHMLGAILPQVSRGEVVLRFANPAEAIKAAVHDQGVNKDVYVSSHRRGTHVNAKGQRVSRKEVALDKKRKNKRVFSRIEKVDKHPRHMNVKRRHFFDITLPRETELLLSPLANGMLARVTKSVK